MGYKFENNAKTLTHQALTDLSDDSKIIRGVLYDISDIKRFALGIKPDMYLSIENGSVSAISFGLKSDYNIDQTALMQSAIDYCKLSNLSLNLESMVIKVTSEIDASGVIIRGNNALILADFAEDGNVILWNQTIGSDIVLEQNSYEGDSFINCTDETIELNDLLLITSSKDFGTDGGKQGEIHEVKKIDSGLIYFNDHLFDTYIVSDSPKINVIKKSTGGISGVAIVGLNDDTTLRLNGLRFQNIFKPIVENVSIYNTYQRGVAFSSCFAPYINNFYINNTCLNSYGYGVGVSSSTMYATIVNGQIFGSRHCISTGGGVYGVPWEVNVYNVKGSIGNITGGTCFDAHRSTGSITYDNCHAIGGSLIYGDVDQYSEIVIYAENDKVRYNDTIFISKQNNNTGNAITDTVNWELAGLINQGFNLRCKNKIRIENCTATNLMTGIGGVGIEESKSIFIKNFKTFNCRQDIIINTSVLKSLYIDGLHSSSDYVSKYFAINVSASIDNICIKNINVLNKQVLKFYNGENATQTITNIEGKISYALADSVGINGVFNVLSMQNIVLTGYDDLLKVNSNIVPLFDGVYIADYASDYPVYVLIGSITNILDCIVPSSPEGIVYAQIGSIARDRVAGDIYFKSSGSGNIGWEKLNS